MSNVNLPEPIAAYFDADRLDETDVANCFTEQGVVRDEGQTYSGREAIKAWRAQATAKYSYTVKPLAIESRDGQHIVVGRVTGNFPGSPVELRFNFRLERRKISFLEITP